VLYLKYSRHTHTHTHTYIYLAYSNSDTWITEAKCLKILIPQRRLITEYKERKLSHKHELIQCNNIIVRIQELILPDFDITSFFHPYNFQLISALFLFLSSLSHFHLFIAQCMCIARNNTMTISIIELFKSSRNFQFELLDKFIVQWA
jgi:hypothetical protein